MTTRSTLCTLICFITAICLLALIHPAYAGDCQHTGNIYDKCDSGDEYWSTQTCECVTSCPGHHRYKEPSTGKCAEQHKDCSRYDNDKYWNESAGECEKQHKCGSHEYWSARKGKCTQQHYCGDDHYWSEAKGSCVKQHDCGNNYYFSQTTGKCMPQHKDCGEGKFWSQAHNGCREVENCGKNQYFSQMKGDCVPQHDCKKGYYWSSAANRCKPVHKCKYNTQKDTCSRVSYDTSIDKSEAGKCLWSASRGKCMQPHKCDNNHYWSVAKGACVKQHNCKHKKGARYYWSESKGKCVKQHNCGKGKYWSIAKDACLKQHHCEKAGQYWSESSHGCKKAHKCAVTGEGKNKTCQEVAITKSVSMQNASQCYWSESSGQCKHEHDCPKNKYWSEAKGECRKQHDCGDGQYWSQVNDECRDKHNCKDDQYWDAQSGECKNQHRSCASGYYYSVPYQKCVRYGHGPQERPGKRTAYITLGLVSGTIHNMTTTPRDRASSGNDTEEGIDDAAKKPHMVCAVSGFPSYGKTKQDKPLAVPAVAAMDQKILGSMAWKVGLPREIVQYYKQLQPTKTIERWGTKRPVGFGNWLGKNYWSFNTRIWGPQADTTHIYMYDGEGTWDGDGHPLVSTHKKNHLDDYYLQSAYYVTLNKKQAEYAQSHPDKLEQHNCIAVTSTGKKGIDGAGSMLVYRPDGQGSYQKAQKKANQLSNKFRCGITKEMETPSHYDTTIPPVTALTPHADIAVQSNHHPHASSGQTDLPCPASKHPGDFCKIFHMVSPDNQTSYRSGVQSDYASGSRLKLNKNYDEPINHFARIFNQAYGMVSAVAGFNMKQNPVKIWQQYRSDDQLADFYEQWSNNLRVSQFGYQDDDYRNPLFLQRTLEGGRSYSYTDLLKDAKAGEPHRSSDNNAIWFNGTVIGPKGMLVQTYQYSYDRMDKNAATVKKSRRKSFGLNCYIYPDRASARKWSQLAYANKDGESSIRLLADKGLKNMNEDIIGAFQIYTLINPKAGRSDSVDDIQVKTSKVLFKHRAWRQHDARIKNIQLQKVDSKKPGKNSNVSRFIYKVELPRPFAAPRNQSHQGK